MIKFSILSDDEVEAIHQATLRILNETGIVLNHPASRALLLDAGARLHHERVRLPPELVETCLAKCPSQVSVRGRNGVIQMLGNGSLNFHNLGGAREIFDHRSGQHRKAVVQDVRDATRLLDALEHCDAITPLYTPQDVPGVVMSLAMYRHALPHTLKPLQGPGIQTAAEARFAVQLAEVIGSPTEILTLSVSPVSPLTLSDDLAAAIIEIARLGIAFSALPCPTAGMTAPLSLAGALAQQNAETLVAIVLAQLVQPGLPVVYCGRLAMMEPRTGASVWSGVELGLASAATVQIGHRYHLTVNVYGLSTNSHVLDVQNGFDRGLNATLPALAGADELSGIGEMEAGVMSSLAQIVADDEFAGSLKRLVKGIAADEDALAVDVIAAVMDGGRNFLAHKHSRRYLKAGEVFVTRLSERGPWEAWERHDRQSMADRAQAEAERILATHQVPPLDRAQEKTLDEIMTAAERELAR
jgi:trimethylamine--corrinoid protein Co-methyltransferase